MTDKHNPQDAPGSTEILQASWLHQSYLIGHPLEQRDCYTEALEVYNNVLEQDRENILVHLLKGKVLLSLNSEEEYQATLRRESLPSTQAQVNLKREEEARLAFYQALQLAEKELQRNAQNTQAWIYKGDALWMMDQQEADTALAAYDQAIHLVPEDSKAYVNKGWVLFVLSRQEALEIFERALQLCPDDPDIHYRLNCVLWEMRQYEEALQAIDQAIKLDSSQPRFYIAKSTVLSYLGRNDEAKEVHTQYLHLVNTQNPSSI